MPERCPCLSEEGPPRRGPCAARSCRHLCRPSCEALLHASAGTRSSSVQGRLPVEALPAPLQGHRSLFEPDTSVRIRTVRREAWHHGTCNCQALQQPSSERVSSCIEAAEPMPGGSWHQTYSNQDPMEKRRRQVLSSRSLPDCLSLPWGSGKLARGKHMSSHARSPFPKLWSPSRSDNAWLG